MKLVYILILICTLSLTAMAQSSMGGVTYQISMPMAESKDFIQKTSFRGFGIEGRHFVSSGLSIGLSANWNVFHEATDKLIILEQASVSGNQNRIINSFPLLATAHLYLGKVQDEVTGYLGLGVGGYRINKTLQLGVFTLEEGNWHFGLAPEIGFLIPIGWDSNFQISMQYNYALESGDASAYRYWGLKLGFASLTMF